MRGQRGLMLASILISVAFIIAECSEQTKSADEVLTAIRDGKQADFDDCTIVDDLCLSGIKIVGPIHFNHTIFQKNANFDGTIISNAAYFHNCTFNNDAIFASTYFSSSADFSYSTFNNDVNFVDSQFVGKANFRKSNFNSDARFEISKFFNSSTFTGSTFKENADFSESLFDGKADFKNSKFDGEANFATSIFKKNAIFENSSFDSDANFDGSRFYEDANFLESKFSKDSTFIVTWYDIKDRLKYDDSAYQALFRTFKSNGLYNEADDCYFTYRYRALSNPLDNPLDYFSLISCGFGVKWVYTIGFAFFVFIFFGSLYFITTHLLRESFAFSAIALLSLPREAFPYSEKKYSKILGNDLKWNIIFLYNLKVPFRFLFSLERLMGMGLLILFINTLSRVMIHY